MARSLALSNAHMGIRFTFALVALGALGACGGSSSSSSSSDAGSDATGGGSLGFTPSNVDLGGLDLSVAGDVVLSGTSSCIIDTELKDGPTFLPCAQDVNYRVAHKIVTLPDQSRISVFVMKSLRIESSTVVKTLGHLPLVLVALDTMELLGSIDVAPGTAGGAFDTAKYAAGSGKGGGTAGDSTGLAGGGGSYCGLGGKGGTNNASGGSAPVAPSPGYGAAEIVPLLAGSAGGSGAVTNDVGSGGGALQLVAGKSFTLHGAAFVNVGGGGGAFGGLGKDGAGGGGSGGALLIESPVITIEGKLAANGGGGGQGNGDSGDPGHPDQVAQGGHKAGKGDPAGNGLFGVTLNGADGPSSADPVTSAGSGGGGAGRIRLNTSAGQAAITGALSPDASSACLSQGTLKK